MDMLNKFTGGSSSKPATTTTTTQSGNKPDIGDKVFGGILKKTGHDSQVSESNREKITDGVRGFYEKTTGKKVNPKISN
ncbi:uncharacterized protein JN550_013348 [Neoarthrinium moseri]|uniref:uncharacterized protein n=1 Tax=Neoarthrinium moseri TaxID=1658444 RepID=UPI001FDC9EE4|nr:uncharacterized protein JN550_013348 [Neoarthrinium moseri]KAI1857265.1 hypothetical protein JN550_013348 [Neoarthrinium moseri]